MYPLIYDEDLGIVKIDDICPYRDEFKITERDIQRLTGLLIRISKESRDYAVFNSE